MRDSFMIPADITFIRILANFVGQLGATGAVISVSITDSNIIIAATRISFVTRV